MKKAPRMTGELNILWWNVIEGLSYNLLDKYQYAKSQGKVYQNIVKMVKNVKKQ